MKHFYFLVIPVVLLIAACQNGGEPMDSSGLDPLRPPSGIQVTSGSYGTDLRPGQFVNAAIDNTAFYKNEPKGDQEADRLLGIGTEMKIVAISGSHAKVELDSGEVGFVPTVMVSSVAAEPIAGEYEVYNPVIGLDENTPLPVVGLEETTPLPEVDPDGITSEDSIPTLINPDALEESDEVEEVEEVEE